MRIVHIFDRKIEREVIAACVRKLKILKLMVVRELLKYGGSDMIGLLQQLLAVVWREECV